MASWLRKLGRTVSKVAKLPGVNMLPGVSMAASALDVGLNLASVTSGGSRSPGLPQLPAFPSSARASSPAMSFGAPVPAAFATQAAARTGIAPPPLTIDLINQMKAAGLLTGNAELLNYKRSPRKDQVVVNWPGGGVVALNKRLARAWGMWKPAKKPPISVGEMSAVNKANSVVKKFTKLERSLKKVANFRAGKAKSRNIIIEQSGRKVIGRKVA